MSRRTIAPIEIAATSNSDPTAIADARSTRRTSDRWRGGEAGNPRSEAMMPVAFIGLLLSLLNCSNLPDVVVQ
jgi:hypothetical protein